MLERAADIVVGSDALSPGVRAATAASVAVFATVTLVTVGALYVKVPVPVDGMLLWPAMVTTSGRLAPEPGGKMHVISVVLTTAQPVMLTDHDGLFAPGGVYDAITAPGVMTACGVPKSAPRMATWTPPTAGNAAPGAPTLTTYGRAYATDHDAIDGWPPTQTRAL